MNATPREFDVVVVGFGAAGAAAAIEAADRGATVAILEKQASDRHTPSTVMSGGLIMTVLDVERATSYLDTCAQGLTPREVSRAWAQKSAELRPWLEKALELEFQRVGPAEHAGVDGVDAIEVLQLKGPETTWAGPRTSGSSDAPPQMARELWAAVRAAVERRSDRITVLWESPGSRLTTEDGRVTGVRYGDASQVIRARKGVVLTCGGYEFDEELKRQYLPATPIHFYGNPGNTGDGIRMAQDVGADLWHMNLMVGRAVMRVTREDGGEHGLLVRVAPGGYVLTDGDGRRYMDESVQAELGHTVYYDLIPYDGIEHRHPRIPSYWFFDERRRSVGPLTPPSVGLVGVGLLDWDADNAAQIASGLIPHGDTVEEAALAAGMTPEAARSAVATIEAYNAGCETGDDEQGRPADSLEQIASPPYYCVPLYPGGSNTSGGPRRDARARVLTPYGEPIPGLYAAGELGQVAGAWYPSAGGNLADAFCFGMIAAEDMLGG